MHRLNLIAVGLFCLYAGYAAVTANPAHAADPGSQSGAGPAEVIVKDVSGQTISFAFSNSGSATSASKPPRSVKTGLFELDYVATLKPHDQSIPYFLFTANPCDDCSPERALYLIRPVVSGKPEITPFVYPGKILDPRTRAVVLESRAFYGRCLALGGDDPGDDVYVVFQRERVDTKHGRRHHILDSVYVAHASSDFLRDKLIERRLPPLRRTLAFVKAHRCHEISGRNRLMELHPRGLDWQNIQHDDERDTPDGDDDAAPAAGSPPPGGAPAASPD